MKKIYISQLMLLASIMLLIGCGSGSTEKPTAGVPSTAEETTLAKQVAIDPVKESTIRIEGKNEDIIELRFAKNTLFGQGTDPIDVNITLTYLGDTLTGFSVDKDLVFAKTLYIAFDVASLKDNERFLEYIHTSDGSKNYFLPFTIEGDSIVYEFSHFSKYIFRPNSVGDKINRVSFVLQSLKNTTDKNGGIRPIEQQINEVYSLISIIGLNDTSVASTLQGEANDIVIEYGTAFIENSTYTGALLNGYCIHPSLTEYTNELVFNGSTLAALGASENSLSKSLTYLHNAADAFLDINTTELCVSTDAMRDYSSCGVDIAEKLYALGDGSGKDSLILSHVEDVGPIIHNGLTYCKVTSPYTSKVWLDRNIGAGQVCKNFNDIGCYGGYYNWEDATSICPIGFSLPSIDELVVETLSNGVIDSATAFENFLKLPSAGSSNPMGNFFYRGLYGYLWSSDGTNDEARGILFYDDSVPGASVGYASEQYFFGLGKISVRCLKN